MAQPAPKPHPFTRVVPPLQAWEFDYLKDSIDRIGQKDPILLYEGGILDGIHRDRACRELHIEPWYKPFQGNRDEAKAIVLARLCVRNTTASQRAMVAADLANIDGPGRPSGKTNIVVATTISQQAAADQAGVSRDAVNKATKVLKRGAPELVEAVREGKVSVSDAAKVAGKPPEAQKAAVEAKVNGHARTASAAADDGPPPGPADELGLVVPESLRNTFEAREQFTEAGRLIKKLQSVLNDIAKAPGGEFLQRRLSCRVVDGRTFFRATKLIELSTDLKASEPYASRCPFCQEKGGDPGPKCAACQGRGWVSVMAWEQASEQVRERTLKANAGGKA